MLSLSINLTQCPVELSDGLSAVMADFPDRFVAGIPVTFTSDPAIAGLRVAWDAMK